MKKQWRILLFMLLTLVMMTMTVLVISADPADGDTETIVTERGETFDENSYNFKVVNKDGNIVGYYISFWSGTKGTAGGAWSAVPEGGTLYLLQDVDYGAATAVYLYNSASFTFDGQGHTISYANIEIYGHPDNGTTVLTNIINISDVTVDAKTKCPFVLAGYGTTYNFAKATLKSTASYGICIRGGLTKVNLNGQENSIANGTETFKIEAPTYLTIHGGNYSNTSANNMIYCNTAMSDEIITGFHVVITINGGKFERKSTSSATAFKGAVVSIYKGATKAQVNISGGELIGRGAVVFSAGNALTQLNITGGTFKQVATSGTGPIHFNTAETPTTVDGNGNTITSSVNISNATFENACTGMPTFCFRNQAKTQTMPMNITIKNVTVDSKARLIGFNTASGVTSYFEVTLENVTATTCQWDNASNAVMHAENSANVTITFNNCVVASNSNLIYCNGIGTVDVAINGGTYTIGETILNVTSTSTVTLSFDGGTFVLTADEATDAIIENANTVVTLKNIMCLSKVANSVWGTILFDASSPTVKFGGETYMCYAFLSSNAEHDIAADRVGASVYIGTDTTQSGLRFTTTLSTEAIKELLALKNSGATLTFGTLIAPADYVIAAGAFTKEALNALDVSPAYVDVIAQSSLRDHNGDGIPEEFSGSLINIKAANYARMFAAIAYVEITSDNQTTVYYSSFNTDDHARSIKEIATYELSRISDTLDDTYPYPSICYLNKYSPYTEAEQLILNTYTGTQLIQNVTVPLGNTQQLLENATDYTWLSSDETVATVENGIVTALLPGTTTITATNTEGVIVLSCTFTSQRPDSGIAVFPVRNEAELCRALSVAQNGDDIRLDADITLTETVSLSKSVRLTAAAARTVTGTSGIGPLFTVSTACAPIFDGNISYHDTDADAAIINVSATSGTVTLTVNNGAFYALSGSAVAQTGACTLALTLNGGTLYGLWGFKNTAGIANVTVNGATFIITNSTETLVSAGIHFASNAGLHTLQFNNGKILSCGYGETGYQAEDAGLDHGIYATTSTKSNITIAEHVEIRTTGSCLYTENILSTTAMISGGYFTSEQDHVIFFDANPATGSNTTSRLTITGGTFIGNNTADATLYVTCNGTSATTGLTECNIYGGDFKSEKWCAVRASHSGVLNIYGGNFSVLSGNGGVVVSGTGSARAYVHVYGGTYYHEKTASGSIFLNGNDNTVLTIHGDFNAIGGSTILSSNASTTILGSPTRSYDEGVYFVNDSIYMLDGARIRLNATEPGITFTGIVPQDIIDTITANGGTDLSYGTLIVLAEQLYKKQVSFTIAELERAGIAYENIVASDGLVARDDADGGGYYIRASLTGIDAANYMREYAAVVYVKYTVNGNEVIQYSTYDADKNAISISAAAGIMLDNEEETLTAEQITIVNQFLVNATVNGVSVDSYTILTDDTTVSWSEYIGYIQNGVLDLTGHKLNIATYSSTALAANRCIVLSTDTSLATMAYQITLSDDDIYITVGSEPAALTLVIAFMENNLKANGTDTLAITFTAKTGLAGKDYKIANTNGSTIRMMTYNTLGCGTFNTSTNNQNYITASMAAYAPDFIGTQEHYNDESTQTALASIGYAKACDTVTSLAPNADELDESTYGGIGGNTATEILYLTTRWEIVESGAFRYHWEYRCAHTGTKTVAWCVFRSLETEELVLVINFHGAIFLSDYRNHEANTGYAAACSPTGSNSVEGRAWRLANAKTIVELFDGLREKYPGILTAIMGDFNSTVTEASTKVFEQHEALSNVLNMLSDMEKTPGNTSHSVGEMPSASGTPIDHIFLTEDVATAKKHIIVQDPITIQGSDHAPVVVDLARK